MIKLILNFLKKIISLPFKIISNIFKVKKNKIDFNEFKDHCELLALSDIENIDFKASYSNENEKFDITFRKPNQRTEKSIKKAE